MKRFIFYFVMIGFSLTGIHIFPEEEITTKNSVIGSQNPIKDVLLIDKRNMDPRIEKPVDYPVPEHLIFGIITKHETFFKISFENKTVASGQLTTGLNEISIPSYHLFGSEGLHRYTYILEVKEGDQFFRKNIYLDITIKSDSLKKASIDSPVKSTPSSLRVYKISILFGDRLLDSIYKAVDPLRKLSELSYGEPEVIPFDPAHPAPGSNPSKYAASISPLTLLALGYKMVDKKIKDNKYRKMLERLEKTRWISGEFFKRNEDDITIPIRIDIRIIISDNP